MKQTKNLWGGEYTAPTLEVLDIAVEQGFASSTIEWLEGGGGGYIGEDINDNGIY